MSNQRLWEYDHPYYCSDSCFTERGALCTFDSWPSFYEEMGQLDKDLNLVFRWDWKGPDADSEREHHELWLFYMQQRKGRFIPMCVKVKPEDEPAARAWLKEQWEYMQILWAGVSGWEPSA